MDELPSLESWDRFDLLSISEASAYLRVSEPMVRALVRDHLLGAVHIGRKLYFTKLHIMAFIEGNCDEPSA